MNPDHIQSLYCERFRSNEERRQALWHVLCEHWFQRDIPKDSSLLELGSGYGEFINQIEAREKSAIDINPESSRHVSPSVKFYAASVTQIPLAEASVDVVFASNLLEHLERHQILDCLREVRRVLRPGGRILLLQTNIRFLVHDYWMFYDHVTPIDDRALCELLISLGFVVQRCIPRFLPFTTKSWLPTCGWLIRLYLRVPFVWRWLGGQAYVVAAKC